MKVYLVGGAVRDELLGIEIHDKDWLVTGATPQQMMSQGYSPVGKDFPVFLHPETGEEYALARKERKTGKGYKGFACISDPSISVDDDLLRRDLTINAIAKDGHGKMIDPYNGIADIKHRVLRHVSPAFIEDPLRVLRVARFAARFSHLGFTIADETMALMQSISQSEELEHLSIERIVSETIKGLASNSPDVYIQVLRDCGALKVLFPEIDALFGVPQTATHHPEIDTGIHTLMALQQAAKLSTKPSVRFAALCHDLGKALTSIDALPKHHGHEISGLALVKALCKRLQVPNDYRDLALISCQYHLHGHRAFELKPSTLENLFKACDSYRRVDRFHDFLIVCEADSRGRLGLEDRDYPQHDFLKRCQQAAAKITMSDIDSRGLQGKAIGLALKKARINIISQFKKNHLKGNGFSLR